MDVEGRLRAAGIVLVLRPSEPSLVEAIASTLLASGIGAIEITFRTPGAAAAIKRVRTMLPELLVGAGTVLTRPQAIEAIEAGAEFIVAPGSNPEVIRTTLDAGVAMIPGVATPTEVEANLERGLSILKLFPAEVIGGVGMLRALRGPYPNVRFVPTGGIGTANLGSYLAEPNVIACGGSWLADGVTRAAELSRVSDLCREAAAIVAQAHAPVAQGPR